MSNKVIIVKMLGVPAELLASGLPVPYPVSDDITVMSLSPDFDVIKRKVTNDSDPELLASLPVVVNLVFDTDAVAHRQATEPVELSGCQIAHVGAEHFSSAEVFSNFVVALGMADLSLTDHFWIPVRPVLTRREMEILHLVYNGKSSKQIAEILAVSPRTIELHRQNCSGKVGPLTPRLLGALLSTDTLEAYRWHMSQS